LFLQTDDIRYIAQSNTTPRFYERSRRAAVRRAVRRCSSADGEVRELDVILERGLIRAATPPLG